MGGFEREINVDTTQVSLEKGHCSFILQEDHLLKLTYNYTNELCLTIVSFKAKLDSKLFAGVYQRNDNCLDLYINQESIRSLHRDLKLEHN